MLNDLYQEIILDHSKRPRNNRALEGPSRTAEGYNPLCGDKIKVFVSYENGVVKDISFQGSGCAISTASASLMTETLKGKTKEQAEAIIPMRRSDFVICWRMATGNLINDACG